MPVQVVLNPQAGLRGAGYYAAFIPGEWSRRCHMPRHWWSGPQAAADFVSVAANAAASGRFTVALSRALGLGR